MNLTPELQSDLVAGMRAAVPKICGHCAAGRGFGLDGKHVYDICGERFGDTQTKRDLCRSVAERRLLSRVDGEIAAKGASDAE